MYGQRFLIDESLVSERAQRVGGRDAPELAIPYSLPATMARCAFASLVEAIIFIDYTATQYRPGIIYQKTALL